jgi:hypothetical protein
VLPDLKTFGEIAGQAETPPPDEQVAARTCFP